MNYFLGLFGGQGPNPSAALFKDGEMLAMAEEERFLRVKNAPSYLPINSIIYCLNFAKIEINQIEKIGFGWDSPHYVSTWPTFSNNIRSQYPHVDHTYNLNYERRLMLGFDPTRIREDLKFGLAKRGQFLKVENVNFYKHHRCHAASTFFQSGFKKSLVICIDGSGEEISTSIWIGKNSNLELIHEYLLPHTLGGFYATFTEFLGFKANSEEGKLMGLAPYGEFSSSIQQKLRKFINLDKNLNLFVNTELRFFGSRTFNNIFTDEFVKIFGKPRLKSDPITSYHKNLAFNVQFLLENIVIKIVKKYIKKTKMENLCLAGGVAMNCKMNGKIAQLPVIKNIFVQPASSDNGVSIGAALLAASDSGVKNFRALNHCYYGPSYTNVEIEGALVSAKVKYSKPDKLMDYVAEKLNSGKIVGWFQGRAEFGARALGNRSILANPLYVDMRDKLNAEVKKREAWRPFCPSVISEKYHQYFGDSTKNSFMILAFPVVKKYRSKIPAVVHVDGTARPQSVDKDQNPRFHSLLKSFGKISGHPILINTSFNVQGEPIVETPQDALRCFFSTGLDLLVMGDFVVEKNVSWE